ncbi:O-linked N-acetylglucosamine transferase, SPINDLY family protein [Trichothermofontia sichuanensis B231]|uniref:O-linked N-acetylglucosamine transferase, SPINDLY family protein n=1 Tax=Trichothermofontia sichuanensis TaxID=3045816 RepID=UPI0022451E93|nr:O-linked N-acetylglucosamine transferase, SPINDLY family protein [Trichothermofontia sichuanensis]UZQ53468.1 O-linked N-acetylglucosamine transferase, SPINDLY family protein [Trichothermofontia sichuanensis B231]
MSDLATAIALPASAQDVPQLIAAGDYAQARQILEDAIAASPEVITLGAYLGVAYLLEDNESQAYLTWLLCLEAATETELAQQQQVLITVLETVAQQQESQANHHHAWLIRKYLREFNPEDINNTLKLVQLAIATQTYTSQEAEDWFNAIDFTVVACNSPLQAELLNTLQTLLENTNWDQATQSFFTKLLQATDEPRIFSGLVLTAAIKFSYAGQYKTAIDILERYLQFDPDCLSLRLYLVIYYREDKQFQKSIATAKLCYDKAIFIIDRIFAINELLYSLISEGNSWHEALKYLNIHQELLQQVVQSKTQSLTPQNISILIYACFTLPYFRDSLKQNRLLQNQILKLCQEHLRTCSEQTIGPDHPLVLVNKPYKQKTQSPKRLRIGYLSYCLRTHSVGWLARWLMAFHDKEKFDIFAYSIRPNLNETDQLTKFYQSIVPNFKTVVMSGDQYHDYLDIAEKIYADDIDILIDLDSITLDLSCKVLATKPASIQVSWLGWDAPGLPAVDYFIADPYVLPDRAQDYYTETLWRLPHTYIAVGGFELGVPTLRRSDLNLPSDAVIYYSSQNGRKRHPDTIRLQMKILSQVPNSYFLIKGVADEVRLRELFSNLAEAEGVSCDRLRFLPATPTEAIHRANLGIADVVLDTYPYNGATTTLETLWVGVPLVTRVGEQFASRNSYTMLVNAGVEEGIAWTDDEYVEWGVRFGKEPELRQQVSWKLKRSRHSAPLWNPQQFTREMEAAYQQMWENYGN